MVTVTLKLTNEQARRWAWLLGKKYNKDKTPKVEGLAKFVMAATAEVAHAEAQKIVDAINAPDTEER